MGPRSAGNFELISERTAPVRMSLPPAVYIFLTADVFELQQQHSQVVVTRLGFFFCVSVHHSAKTDHDWLSVCCGNILEYHTMH